MLIIHDYKDADYYENLKLETNMTRWGWEFLRRNPEYQAEYKRFASFPDHDEVNGVKNGKWKGNVWFGARFYEDAFHYTNPPAKKGETLEEYDQRCPDGEIMPFREYLEYKYHIQPTIKNPSEELRDPEEEWFYFSDINNDSPFWADFPPWEIDVFPECLSTGLKGTRFEKEYSDRFINRMAGMARYPGAVFYAFDVRQSIDEQVTRVKQYLIEAKKEYYEQRLLDDDKPPIKRPQKTRAGLLSIYIRILDVIDSGITSVSEIAKIIYPDDKSYDPKNAKSKVRSNIERAKEIRDSEYWLLKG